MCGRSNSSYFRQTDSYLKVRSGEYIGISPLTFRKVKPSKEAHGHKYILEIKESLLIKRDRLVLNKNISSASLFLFDDN